MTRETQRTGSEGSNLKPQVFQKEEKRMSDKTLMVCCCGTHQKVAREKRAGSFLTHPTESSPCIPFICDNVSRSVSLHGLYRLDI